MARAHSTIIPAEHIGAVSDWRFAAVDQAGLRFAAKLKAQAEAEERALSSAARDAGYAQGYDEGYAKGLEEGRSQATLEGQAHLNTYIATQGQEAARAFWAQLVAAQGQLLQAEQAMAQGVLEMACEIARQVLRRELQADPHAVQPVVREALGVLAADSKAAVVRLHPEDAQLFADVLQKEFSTMAMSVVPDASLARGGCLVESAGTVVDGTLERRWQRAVAALGLDAPWAGVGDD